MKSHVLVVCLASIALTGCGGGGSKGSSASISLSASQVTVDYGQSVSISWSSSGIDHMNTGTTNFPISSNQLSGSFADKPSYDTTYVIKGVDTNGNVISKSKVVKVNKSTKKIVVLGDPATSGVPQIAQSLQALTTAPVSISLSMPTLTGVDVLVLLPSAAYTASDNATVAGYLTSGGSVILVDQAPKRLATGNFGVGDVSAIGSWCAGVTTQSTNGNEYVVPTSPAGIPISATLFGDSFADGYDLAPISSNATILTTNINAKFTAFVYMPPSGGKVGFVGAPGIGTSEGDLTAKGILLSEVRWALPPELG